MGGQIPENIKQQRVDALMLAQQEIAFELTQERISARLDVLVEANGMSKSKPGW